MPSSSSFFRLNVCDEQSESNVFVLSLIPAGYLWLSFDDAITTVKEGRWQGGVDLTQLARAEQRAYGWYNWYQAGSSLSQHQSSPCLSQSLCPLQLFHVIGHIQVCEERKCRHLVVPLPQLHHTRDTDRSLQDALSPRHTEEHWSRWLCAHLPSPRCIHSWSVTFIHFFVFSSLSFSALTFLLP